MQFLCLSISPEVSKFTILKFAKTNRSLYTMPGLVPDKNPEGASGSNKEEEETSIRVCPFADKESKTAG